uniref:helix-turn-helix domain-containing protein n=1 Tax=Bacteroides intestinalis TaxID=329854 RepID=UPI0005C849B9
QTNAIQMGAGKLVLVIGTDAFNMTMMTANAGGSLGKSSGKPVIFSFLSPDQPYEQMEAAETYNQYELLFWQALHKVRDEQYFLKSDLTIETLADVLNTNRSYLSVSINRFCDKGFSVWLNNFRIQHAEQLMRENPSIALKDLPEQCGYATTGTFVRNFKRCHNMSPSEFMNKLLIEQTLPKVEKAFQ